MSFLICVCGPQLEYPFACRSSRIRALVCVDRSLPELKDMEVSLVGPRSQLLRSIAKLKRGYENYQRVRTPGARSIGLRLPHSAAHGSRLRTPVWTESTSMVGPPGALHKSVSPNGPQTLVLPCSATPMWDPCYHCATPLWYPCLLCNTLTVDQCYPDVVSLPACSVLQ